MFQQVLFCCSFYFETQSGVIFQSTRVKKIVIFFSSEALLQSLFAAIEA
jgi:hypothetical protein